MVALRCTWVLGHRGAYMTKCPRAASDPGKACAEATVPGLSPQWLSWKERQKPSGSNSYLQRRKLRHSSDPLLSSRMYLTVRQYWNLLTVLCLRALPLSSVPPFSPSTISSQHPPSALLLLPALYTQLPVLLANCHHSPHPNPWPLPFGWWILN